MPLEADDEPSVSLIDYYGQAWIKKVEVLTNSKSVSEGGGYNYFVKTCLNTIINYGTGATEGHLRTAGFAPDDAIPARAATDEIGLA